MLSGRPLRVHRYPAGEQLQEHNPVAVHVRLGRQLPRRRVPATQLACDHQSTLPQAKRKGGMTSC